MAFLVGLSGPAELDAYEAYERISDGVPMQAERWLVQWFQANLCLEEMLARCTDITD